MSPVISVNLSYVTQKHRAFDFCLPQQEM